MTCDGCDSEATGYTTAELLKQGWKRHLLKDNRVFVLCPACAKGSNSKDKD